MSSSDTAPISADDIEVSCQSCFIPEQSDERDQRFVFSYTITISNHGEQPIQLLSRNWLITDSDGKIITVQGDGVIGQQPVIQPHKSFSYSSGSVLKTPVGTMQGHYDVKSDAGMLQVPIPVFRLAMPNILN